MIGPVFSRLTDALLVAALYVVAIVLVVPVRALGAWRARR